ncbi:hypothetical protein E2C01_096785 [Portunus trituberculatus]|uniref:Uncharacterized protein n=1 Tax=Portunus trituberculatus TaxID=210409 RepID=A0A5B7K2Y5_PORTR|nr:hypothetical protein [Portunus trituberculatus]
MTHNWCHAAFSYSFCFLFGDFIQL